VGEAGGARRGRQDRIARAMGSQGRCMSASASVSRRTCSATSTSCRAGTPTASRPSS
jgi:hypothetical protein